MVGWFDVARDGGHLRQAVNSYLPDPADAFIPTGLVRTHQLRRGDKLEVGYGSDQQRGRLIVSEVVAMNDGPPIVMDKRPDFNTLTASYPDRKLTLEDGSTVEDGTRADAARHRFDCTHRVRTACVDCRAWRVREKPRCCRPL